MVTVAPSEPATGAVKTTDGGVGASGAKLPELASISASALAAARVITIGRDDPSKVASGPTPSLSIASVTPTPTELNATQHSPEPSNSSNEGSRPNSATRQTLSEEEDEGFNEEASSTSSSIVSSGVRNEFDHGGSSPEGTTERPSKVANHSEGVKKVSSAPVSFTVSVISTTARPHHHHHLHVHQHTSHPLRVHPIFPKIPISCSCSNVSCEHQKQSRMNAISGDVVISQESGPKESAQLSNNFDISRLKSITMGGFIKGSTGSVRGKRNNVRQSISNYTKMVQLVNTEKGQLTRDYQAEEANKCVLYVTSLGIIRKTFDESKALKAILNNHFINYEERDIFINVDFKQELRERLSEVKVPALFVKGNLLGFYLEIEKMNESGELATSLACFKLDLSETNGQLNGGSQAKETNPSVTSSVVKRRPGECARCGGRRFINCDKCNGSCKTFVHHFPHTSITLKCSVCKRKGLVRCPECNPAPEPVPAVPSQISN